MVGIDCIEGESPQAKRMKQEVLKIADSPTSVLVLGEKGLEKEKIVRAIHEESKRKDQLFLIINCAVDDQERLEKELFSTGRCGKAFTGTSAKNMGVFREWYICQV